MWKVNSYVPHRFEGFRQPSAAVVPDTAVVPAGAESKAAFNRTMEEYLKNRTNAYGHLNLDRFCRSCSELFDPQWFTPTVIQHKHNSSIARCVNLGVDDSGMWACGVCESSPHPFLMSDRRSILVTSSMLNDAYKSIEQYGFQKDAMHVDYIGIPGATLQVLLRALAAETTHSSMPMDILIAAGHNNILRGHTIEELKNDMDRIISWTSYQNSYHPGTYNTVAFVTLPPFPKVVNPTEMKLQIPGSVEQLLFQFNEYAKRLNRAFRLPAPQFHTWTVRFAPSDRGVNGGRPLDRALGTQASTCREAEPWNMLHFSDRVRARAWISCVKYFQVLSSIHETSTE